MKIGEAVRLRILELCEERGLTPNALANLCGVTQSTLANIIGGRNRSTTISTIKKLCDGLEMNIGDFFSSALFTDLEQEIQ